MHRSGPTLTAGRTPAPDRSTGPTTSTAAATGPPAISVTGLTKRYGPRTVVDAFDLEVPRGVVAGFVGPNGAGKTTTMSMLLGLVRPSAGTGTVLGEPLTDPATYLRRVGAMVEGPAFYPSLSGRRNLAMFATIGRHDPASVDRVLDVVGLADRADDRYRSYSLGMKQRLGIAAALLGDPELLVLDEPANGLDPQGVREMRALIGAVAGRGRTVLVSSHDLSELEQLCDWLVLIDTGRSLYQGPADALLDADGSDLTVRPAAADQLDRLQQVLADRDLRSTRDGDRLVLRSVADPAAVAAAVNRTAFDAGITLVELVPARTSLEDRYLSLVEGATP